MYYFSLVWQWFWHKIKISPDNVYFVSFNSNHEYTRCFSEWFFFCIWLNCLPLKVFRWSSQIGLWNAIPENILWSWKSKINVKKWYFNFISLFFFTSIPSEWHLIQWNTKHTVNKRSEFTEIWNYIYIKFLLVKDFGMVKSVLPLTFSLRIISL